MISLRPLAVGLVSLSLIGIATITRAQQNAPAKVIELKIADSLATSHALSKSGGVFWMKRVEELSGGAVKFRHFPAQQMGKASDMLKLVNGGVVDVAYVATPYFASQMPLGAGIGGLPGLYTTSLIGSRAYWMIANQEPMLGIDFLKNGVRPVAAIMIPTYELLSRKQLLRTPSDVKGLKVRSAGGAQDLALQAVGAVPVSTPAPEVYEALERGVIDAIPFSFSSGAGYRLEEVVKYATHGLGFPAGAITWVINEKVWQALPEDIKDVMRKASDETVINVGKTLDAAEQSIRLGWAEKGIRITSLSRQELDQWHSLLGGVASQWVLAAEAKQLPAKQTLDMFKEAVQASQ